jgi:uncharacterized membrane protein
MNDSKKGEENNSEILSRESSTPQEQRGPIIAVSYEGILPPAQELVRYNHAQPDAAHRIITMAEKQETHRQKLETIGLIFGFIIVVMVIGMGAFLIFNDKPGTGLVIALSGLATLIWPFIMSSRTKAREKP